MDLLNNLSQNRFVYLFTFLLVLSSLMNFAIILPERSTKNDFAHYYLATKIFLEGKNPYKTDLGPLYSRYGFVNEDIIKKIISPYPPTFLYFFIPFAKLDPNKSFIGWVLLETISLCSILWLTKILLVHRMSNRAWIFYCAAIFSSTWVYGNLFYSQLGLLLTALVLFGYTLHRNENYTAACIIISIAGLLKFIPFILLPWFLIKGNEIKKVKFFRSFFIVIFLTLIILITDLKDWHEFIMHSINSVTADSLNRTYNYSLPSFIINLGHAWYDFNPTKIQALLWSNFGTLIGLSLIGICYFVCFINNEDFETEFCILCLAMLSGSIRTFGHYFVFLIFPMGVAFVRSYSFQKGFLIIVATYVILNFHLLFFTIPSQHLVKFLDNHIYIKILLNFLPGYGLIILMFYFFTEITAGSEDKNQIHNNNYQDL